MATRKKTKEANKETSKEAVKKQDNIEEFIELAKELKETMITVSERMSKVESINDKIKQRLGL